MAGSSAVGGLVEAALLVAVAQAAAAVVGDRSVSFDTGPLRFHASVGQAVGVALVLTLVRLGIGMVTAWSSARLVAGVQRDVRLRVLRAYVDAGWETQSREREGGLQQLVGVESERSAQALVSLATGMAAGCTLAVLVASAMLVNPVAALSVVVGVGGLFAVLRPLTRRARRNALARSTDELGMSASVDELLRTSEEVRVHGVGEARKRHLAEETARVARLVARLHQASLATATVYQSLAIALLVAALFVVDRVGTASVGDTGAIVLILLRAFAYSQQLQHAWHQYGERRPSLELIERRRAALASSTPDFGRAALVGIGRVALWSVGYSYPGGAPALRDVSLEVEPGRIVGILGPSGAGKSTLVQILLRLRRPDTGRYLVGGRSADDFDEADWARLVSYLPQDPKLITASVADNIRFLRSGISDAEVERAARLANIHDEIVTWPGGYEAMIGPRSQTVSGGQRQRLCLARALLTRPELLVLDEPMSALDARAEHLVRQTLAGLRGETTVFIVAHGIGTLSICDELLVLRAGRVEALGSPRELAERGGFYHEALRLSRLAGSEEDGMQSPSTPAAPVTTPG